MRKLASVALVLIAAVTVYASDQGRAPGEKTVDGVRVIRAVAADEGVVLDGKLDEACWRKARPVTGFLGYNSPNKAGRQSFASVCYDDAYLYVGVKGLLPKGEKPVGKQRPHDEGALFADDVFEIMIDPGGSRTRYFQLVANAYGGTFDCARQVGGAHEDDAWNGDWKSAAHIDDGFYSLELAIPYHNLGITPRVGSTWGINVCRECKSPAELSSIAAGGAFNNADKFAVVTGLNVDFKKYLFRIGPSELAPDPSGPGPVAMTRMPVTNLSDRPRKIEIAMYRAGTDEVEKHVATLKPGQSFTCDLGQLPLRPFAAGRTDLYLVGAKPAAGKIVVSDANTGTVLALSLVKERVLCPAMDVRIDDPWKRDISPGGTNEISMTVATTLAQRLLDTCQLVVNIRPRGAGEVAATKTISSPGRSTEVRIAAARLPWGAYDATVAFQDQGGKAVASTTRQVTVLPGGEQHIAVLSNLVSELMNAKQRGLLGAKTIEFMNPRDGWCCFQVSGSARIRLDDGAEPIASGTPGGIGEAMRPLPAGRHAVHVEGKPEQLIVRAIPELIYCQYRANPHIAPHGPYDWKFLSKDVLPNCNTIIGGAYPEEMKQWRAAGKKWLTHVQVPGIGVEKGYKDMTAEGAYKHWAASPGYSHPMMDGMFADEFTGGDQDPVFPDFAKSILQLADDPKFKGRIFNGWCGLIHGSEAGKILVHAIHEAGGSHGYESYLAEQATEETARQFIQDNLIRTMKGWEASLPDSTKRAIVVLGYMSQPTESLNHYASANYKVYMDMQFEAMANDPALFGLFGIMEYLSSYCDEENVRWAGRLFRHYGIEGRTSRLTSDPYANAHIRNPEFYEGKAHWDIAEAAPGTVTVGDRNGYGWLLGIYPRTRLGDKFLLLKRRGDKPNKFSQEIRNLVPGRLYSLKMMTGDYEDLVGEKSNKYLHPVSIQLDNVDVLPGEKHAFQYPIPNCYAHVLGKFNANHTYWMNYHWRVFRARDATARLTVSDWKSDSGPGAPAGRQLMFNFIEIQPYLQP